MIGNDAEEYPGNDGVSLITRASAEETEMDPSTRDTIAEAVQAIDDAISGLLGFAMTLRPTLRNEILQICGAHLERARQAKLRLESLLASGTD